LCVVALFGLFSRAGAASRTTPPDVLIINSYGPGYDWSDDALAGVLSVVRTRYPEIDPVIQYLDTKRFPLAPREQVVLADIVEKCRLRPPGLIITMDDAAFEFALKHRAFLGADVPVVFGGVNRFDPEMLAGQPNITGVSEETDFQSTFALIRALTPETKRILVINNQTESGQASHKALEENLTAAEAKYAFEFYEDWTNEELVERVRHLPDDTVGFVLDATRDAKGRFNYNNHTFSAAMAKLSSRPIFVNSRPPGRHNWSAEWWLGLGGGLVEAGVHGKAVGELALRVLAGERADAIPVVRRSPVVMEVDYRHLERFGLSLSALPPGTRVLNAPVSFFQAHKNNLLWAAIVFVFLGSVIVAMSINILKRRLAEKALRQAQGEIELLATAMAQASDIILILGPDACVRYANTAYLRLAGQEATQVRDKPFDAIWAVHGDNPGFAHIRRHLAESGLWAGNFILQPTAQAPVTLKVAISPLRDAKGEINNFLFMGRDVTAERKFEDQLRSVQKMEAIGMLAGGIAHDFNNILQVIRCQCGLLLENAALPNELQDGLGTIGVATDRAVQLTRQLLAFSSKESMNLQRIDPNVLVGDLLKMLRRLIGEHIEIKFVPTPESVTLSADSGQLEQVLLNLCVNARDAMPVGGRLSIELRKETAAAVRTIKPDAAPGDYLCIKLSDTGCGMPPEVLARVFEPFFTTKPVGQGTGLGLAVVYGIVQRHLGAISVQSTLGAGTVFEIFLPIVAGPSVSVVREHPRAFPAGKGKVLLAEDDQQVQIIACRILQQNGFDVIAADDGALAIALFDQHQAELRLAVLDVLMPNVSGREVYDHIHRHKPDLPVLFCSGYSAEMLPPGMAPDAGLALLSKPYTVAGLLEAVHRLLDATQRTPGA
jgi:PAS domain S-box-containing protein